MGDLSKNLSRYEMACECGCGFDTVDIKIVEMVQAACDYFADKYDQAVILRITGPNRCKAHNTVVTKNPDSDSQHIYGRALDHSIFFYSGEQVPPVEVFEFYGERYPECGRGLYSNRTHADCRTDGPAVWDTTKTEAGA